MDRRDQALVDRLRREIDALTTENDELRKKIDSLEIKRAANSSTIKLPQKRATEEHTA